MQLDKATLNLNIVRDILTEERIVMGIGGVTFDEINDHLMVSNIAAWQGLCWQIADDKGFHEPEERYDGNVRDASPGERMMLIVSEVAEMLEAFRKDHKPAGFYIEVDGKPEGVATELADVVIRCLDYAQIYGIDLGEVMLAKLRYNATRPHKHGGKHI